MSGNYRLNLHSDKFGDRRTKRNRSRNEKNRRAIMDFDEQELLYDQLEEALKENEALRKEIDSLRQQIETLTFY